jgi:hypothetical protein
MGQSSSVVESEILDTNRHSNVTNLMGDEGFEGHTPGVIKDEVRAQDPVHHNGTTVSQSMNANEEHKQSKDWSGEVSSNKSHSITHLSKDEIKHRLDKLDISTDMFRRFAKQKDKSSDNDAFIWYYNDQAAKESSDSDELYMEIALYILSISPSVRNFRFKLVPSKLSEGHFWMILFDYLCHGSESNSEDDHNEFSREKYKNEVPSDEDLSTLVHRLKLRIKEQEEEIQTLRRKVDELQLNRDDGMIRTESKHKGNWVMDKEAIEFLSLEEEIKRQLREGKKKRMYEISEQMKFILDSDHVKDSRGKWDCCGQLVYCSECNC